MNTKSVLVGAVIALLVVGGIGGVLYGVTQMDNQPTRQTVDESNVSQRVLDSKPGAGALKESFVNEYQYENSVRIKQDGNLLLLYSSSAANGNQLKTEMKQVALLYAEVAANNPEVGALTIRANGVTLTVPADSAIAHGNGDINEEAFFKTIRFDSNDE